MHLTFYLHFEWKALLGGYICILKSQSAGKRASQLENLHQFISQIQKKGFGFPYKSIVLDVKLYVGSGWDWIEQLVIFCYIKEQSKVLNIFHETI